MSSQTKTRKTQRWVTHSPEETAALGERLAKYLKGGDIVCLFGDLGAGKTTMIKGIARGLKINPKKVSSPTFVLMNMYKGRLVLYHFDLYRLENVQGIDSIGYDEFLYGDGASVVEWPDRLGGFMPEAYLKVELNHKKLEERLIKCTAVGERYQKIIEDVVKGQS